MPLKNKISTQKMPDWVFLSLLDNALNYKLGVLSKKDDPVLTTLPPFYRPLSSTKYSLWYVDTKGTFNYVWKIERSFEFNRAGNRC